MIGLKQKKLLKLITPEGESYTIGQTKILIGSSSNCDIIINSPIVSHYHALINIIKDGSVSIMDLESTNGTYINGQLVTKGLIEAEDIISFGSYCLQVSDSFETAVIHNTENKVEVITKEELVVPLKDGLVLIDDEYCDIIFDDQSFVPCMQNPLLQTNYDQENFVDLDSWQTTYPILKETDEKAIRITSLTNGNILDTTYHKLQNKTYYASGMNGKGLIKIDLLDDKDLIEIIKIVNNVPLVQPLPGFEGPTEVTSLTELNVIVFSCNSYQVFIEIVDAPIDLKSISDFQKEKQFYKDAIKSFASIVLPILLLLLIDFNVPKPEKKLSIIYRKAMTSDNNKNIASESAQKTQKDDGHKMNKQSDQKLSFAKAGQKVKSRSATKSLKKVAVKTSTAKPQSTSTTKTKAKVSAYQFKMANMNSLFANTQNVKINTSQNPSSLTAATSTDLNTKINGTTSGNAGSMGQDSRGPASKSFGTKGLTSIAGTDTAYIEPKTVILGSMDPELLRKILQEYLPQFRHCYQQELAYNSEDIKGVVDLNFEIAGSGKVSRIDIKAKDTRFSKRGTNCMTKVLSVIDFPRPKGGGRVAVRQPLNFFSEKERG